MKTKKIKPVVMEFISPIYPYEGAKHYYIGSSQKDILKVAYKGVESKLYNFSKEDKKVIDLKEAEKLLTRGFYHDGYKAVVERDVKAFKLKTPDKIS